MTIAVDWEVKHDTKQNTFRKSEATVLLYQYPAQVNVWKSQEPADVFSRRNKNTVKPVLKGHSKIDKTKVLKMLA